MHKTDVDKLLGKNPSRRRKILLEFAKQPSGVANKVMAETLHIDHSDLVNQHLSVFEEFGVIRKCDVVVKRPMGRVRTPTEISMKGYRLNHDAFATLLNIFVGTDHLEDFLHSSYVDNIELRDLEKIDQIVIDTIINKLKTVQLVCDTFYFGFPLTNELNAILASDGVAAKLSSQRRQQISDVVLNLYRRTNRSCLTVGRFMSDLRILLEQTVSSTERS